MGFCVTRTVQRCYYNSKTIDDRRITAWSKGEVWEMVWTIVAVRSDQRAKSGKRSVKWSQYGLIRGQRLGNVLNNHRRKVWSMVALWSDRRETKVWTLVAQKSDHRALIDRIHLFDCSFLSLFQMTKSCRHLQATFCVYFLLINFVLALTKYTKLFNFKLNNI